MLQGLAEVFSRDFIALVPLALQRVMFVGKHLGDLRNHIFKELFKQGNEGQYQISWILEVYFLLDTRAAQVGLRA